jgi:hypothetical protein
MDWLKNLDKNIIFFLDNLRHESDEFRYKPVIYNQKISTQNLQLGFSCYALKINILLDRVSDFKDEYIVQWSEYLKSFQQIDTNEYPLNSFIDKAYVEILQKNKDSFLKSSVKNISNKLLDTNFKNYNLKLENYIRAETKQTISTLSELGINLDKKYIDFPNKEFEIEKFLNELNWKYPWSSGGQLAAISLFAKTQLSNENFIESKKYIESFLKTILDSKTGFYFLSSKELSFKEKINGSMKVFTALDWLEIGIHSPEKIIDNCLEKDPISEGCDIVDIVYVLYRCSNETDYKKEQIIDYLINLLDLIKGHYKQDQGGFSYYRNRSQNYYYDVNYSNSQNQSDIHGTLLMLWAIVMILKISNNEIFKCKVLKP